MSLPSRPLHQTEAEARRALLNVTAYDVTLDLASDVETFGSRTEITFTSAGGDTWVDLKPCRVVAVSLDGDPVDVDSLDRGRLPLVTTPGEHRLVVEAVMGFRNDGEGLHRSVDPADGRHYVHGMSFMDAAPSVFACFDQPDLKAPYTFHVRAPRDWTVIGNAPATQVEPGVWELATTHPLSTYFVTLVAGPWHVIRDEHDGIPLGLSSRASIARHLDEDADELLTITRACFDEFHRLFGIRYPFGDYHQAFVPEFNAGAMENPGCVTFRDPHVFTSRVTRGLRIQRATTVAHEMAHQWFGNLVTPRWWDDLWLNESFAEYMGNRVTADVTEFTDARIHDVHVRRQWGLVADQRPSTHPVAGNGAPDAMTALQNFDGISYAKGSAILRQLNATMGDEAFLAGAVRHFTSHRFGNATMHDLFSAWEQSGAGDLTGLTDAWLRTAGADVLEVDRAADVVRRTPPPAHPADREHAITVAVARPGEEWRVRPLGISSAETALAVPPDAAVLLDPHVQTWAVALPDAVTVDALVTLLPATTDALTRAGAWSNVRSAFHRGDLDPVRAVDLLTAWLPSEDHEDGLSALRPWATDTVLPLLDDADRATSALHAAALDRLGSAEPGSTLQLAAHQWAVTTATDEAELRGWLEGALSEGLVLDLDVRWALWVRLATLGAVDRGELDAALADEPTAVSRVEHTRAVASLPAPEAKAWAWRRLTGEDDVPNYEITAAGLGMWRAGQQDVTAPYVDRWIDALPTLHTVHSGWVLGDVVRAFTPLSHPDPALVARCHGVLADQTLDPTVRRALVDQTNELERRLTVRQRWGRG